LCREDTLYTFGGKIGGAPEGVIAGPNGVFFGTDTIGVLCPISGTRGTVFELTPPKRRGPGAESAVALCASGALAQRHCG
jgi:hypothetical protein